MKKPILMTAFFTTMLLSANTSAFSQTLYFFVANNTEQTLNNIYVTPAEQNTWGEDILPNDVFENGTKVKITIPASMGQTCKFDMKITDLQGNAVIFKNFDACKLLELTIHWDGTYEVKNETN